MKTGSILYVAILLTPFAFLTPGVAEGVIKTGVYIVKSVADGLVLTSTWEGLPRHVITDEWRDSGLQEWRVESINNNGSLHLVRNEFAINNEVYKEDLLAKYKMGLKMVLVDWTFVPVDDAAKENTFELSNGSGCLKNNGKRMRISKVNCDLSAKDQQWHFDFLYENTP